MQVVHLRHTLMVNNKVNIDLQQFTMVLLKQVPQPRMPQTAILQQNAAAHTDYLSQLKAKGLVSFSGPINEKGEKYELVVFTIADKTTVKTLLDNDPAIKTELFTYQIRSWAGKELA